jgi:hypothetical protein
MGDLADQLADALREVLATVRATGRLPDTTMAAERAMDRIGNARDQAVAALAAYDAARGVTPTFNHQPKDQK